MLSGPRFRKAAALVVLATWSLTVWSLSRGVQGGLLDHRVKHFYAGRVITRRPARVHPSRGEFMRPYSPDVQLALTENHILDGWRGQDVTAMQPHRRARAGIGWVAQEREIFPSLTVEENLTVASRPGRWDLPAVYGLFPRLAERRANMGNQLSGGEQQMLAIARTLMTNPALLLLDEPLEGLAPIIVEELLGVLGNVIRKEGMSAIVVEQKARKILGFTDRAIILDRGRIVYQGDSAALANDPERLEAHLGVTEQKSGGSSSRRLQH